MNKTPFQQLCDVLDNTSEQFAIRMREKNIWVITALRFRDAMLKHGSDNKELMDEMEQITVESLEGLNKIGITP